MDPQLQQQSTKTGVANTSVMSKAHDGAEFWPLSGDPYFYVVIDKSKRFQLNIPKDLSDKLPTATIPAKLVYHNKVWDQVYIGDQATKKFGIEEWGKFMTENNVTVGDVCVFELMEGDSKSRVVKFRVQILKDELPLELMEKAQGFSENNPIEVD